MSKRIFLAAGLVAALAGGTSVAMAQQAPQGVHERGRGPRGGGPGGLGGPGGIAGLRSVNLTEAQRTEVRTIVESHKTERDQVGRKLREAHRALAEATRGDTFDEAAVRARSAEVGAAIADDAIFRARVRAEIVGILTAQQKQKLKERAAATRQRGQERLQQRQQRPPRPQRQ